jgi:hypothetical protein
LGRETPATASSSLCCVLVGLTARELDSRPVRCKMTPNSINARRNIEHLGFRATANEAWIRILRELCCRNQASVLNLVQYKSEFTSNSGGCTTAGGPKVHPVRPSRIQCTTKALSKNHISLELLGETASEQTRNAKHRERMWHGRRRTDTKHPLRRERTEQQELSCRIMHDGSGVTRGSSEELHLERVHANFGTDFGHGGVRRGPAGPVAMRHGCAKVRKAKKLLLRVPKTGTGNVRRAPVTTASTRSNKQNPWT